MEFRPAHLVVLHLERPIWTGRPTIGKRLLGIRVQRLSGASLGLDRALLRTAIKLLPWELANISAFALGMDSSQFSLYQSIWLALANALWMIYLLIAAATKGRRSIHDFAVKTGVTFAHFGQSDV